MNHLTRITLASLGAVVCLPAVASASGPWMVSNPQGATFAAATDCTARFDITTSDGYAGRATTPPQAYELVVVLHNGVEIGRTGDLPAGESVSRTADPIFASARAGDQFRVVHSSVVGLVDGTPNSVFPSITFSCAPAPPPTTVPATTTTVPPTTTLPAPTTTATPEVTAPPTTTVPPVVEVGEPPTTTRTPVAPPRASSTTVATSPPVGFLPETGGTLLAGALGADFLFVGAFVRRLARGRWL